MSHDLMRSTMRVLAAIALVCSAGLSLRTAAAVEYLIQPGDVLSIRVTGESGLSQNYLVDENGDITMDLVGKVHLAGLTSQSAQDELTKQLQKYLKLFDVELSVVGETGGRVLVYGEVLKPGMYRLRPDSRLLDVLAGAGQPTPNADTRRIAIIRKDGEKTETIDLDQALKDPALNLPIRTGDSITVPSRVTYTVMVDGEVRNAGLRPLENFKTAYAAILSAAPTEDADWTRIILHHKDSSVPLIVDLSPVRTGQLKDDLELQPGDQLTVMARFLGQITLRGEVKTPGEKTLTKKMQLLDCIALLGGGFTESADHTKVEVSRDGQPTQTFDLEAVENGQKSSDDPVLEVHPGDIVFVPNVEKKLFAIIGGVKRPGTYPTKPDMSLLDAIVLAGGFTPTAMKKQVVLATNPSESTHDQTKASSASTAAPAGEPSASRTHAASRLTPSSDGPRSMSAAEAGLPSMPDTRLIMVNGEKLLAGDVTQNVPVRAGDRIVVPEAVPKSSSRRPFLEGLLRYLPLITLLP